MEDEKLLLKAINEFGVEFQFNMAIEECAELIDSLCKYRRERVKAQDVITEIADVKIMMDQLSLIFGKDDVQQERERKIDRLRRRIINHNINTRWKKIIFSEKK